ncbi:MAG: class I SAM-dependent methyltransferase [Phenylobacterium sp.]|uniref:class I SAM-dependent methyltransferase n=1 Tax=Phenylobacterium sp. TaxID=1871053 RepID=UPI00391A51EC
MTRTYFDGGHFIVDPSATEGFMAGARQMLRSLPSRDGVFAADNLITMGRNLGFLADEALMGAWERHAEEPHEKAILWRTAVLMWGVRQALRREGAFVECGVYRGTTARILIDAGQIERPFFLYDTFETAERHLPALGPDLEPFVRRRFADKPNVVITKGRAPESLGNAPEQIAFLHIDMNSAEAEVGALEVLFDRLVPGAVLVLDDYGWGFYRDQFEAETKWFAARGYSVLELPTGQGLVIR